MPLRLLLFPVLLLLVQGGFNTVSGQRFQNIEQAEDTLSTVLSSLINAKDDSTKNAVNQIFTNDLYDALKFPSSDIYPFDSLKSLVKISSSDNKFRIFQWNLPAVDGKHRFYGFIKMLDQVPPLIYPLVDKSDSLPFPDTLLLDDRNWFGALYYKIIPVETAAGEKIYTLLGWAGKNSMVTQKVIEVLYFDGHGKPHFGLKLFPGFQGGKMTRIIFRFDASTTMSLKYEKQTIASNKKWNAKKRVFDYDLNETQMIVCDRMVAPDPQMEGQYQFYVAAGDIFDGFVFKHFGWSFIAGIDARNKK